MKNYYKNVREVISKYKTFVVPYYQRRYVWNTANKGRNLYKFIDDICSEYIASEQSTYFIGGLAFCDHDGIVDIVDGQQRITSLVLLLSVLADNFCSSSYKTNHQKNIYHDGKFIIQEDYYLTKELEGVLNYKPYSGTGFKVKLDETVIKIKNQLSKKLRSFSTGQCDGLYDYILDNVFIIGIEYNNVKDALRYFLNINSLSVELTDAEIFYTILSQSLSISHNTTSINDVIAVLERIVRDYKGIKKTDDIIYVFLNSYYSKDGNINDLPELKVGRWMSYYHVEVFGDAIDAATFCKTFLSFVSDFERLLMLLEYKEPTLTETSPLFMTYSLLNYQSFDDLLGVMEIIFKHRHNYRDPLNLYESSGPTIDKNKVEELSKRLNLVLLHNYIRDCNKRLDGLVSAIEIDTSGAYKISVSDLLNNINIDNVFTLGYLEPNSFQSYPKIKIDDKSRLIKVILALQEAFFNHVSNPANSLYKYFADLIQTQRFTIEHLYSVKEFADSGRLAEWIKIHRFENANEFDIERSQFENLTLLNFNSNASANDDIIYDKLNKYNTASLVLSHENEFLVQSLVESSPFYTDANITALGLPERTLKNIHVNTWEHSPNNRDFIRKSIYLALSEIIK